jgi:hypothetical protein
MVRHRLTCTLGRWTPNVALGSKAAIQTSPPSAGIGGSLSRRFLLTRIMRCGLAGVA